MADPNTESTTPSKYPRCVTVKEDCDRTEEEDDRNQVTSQCVINALSRYTVRPNGAFMKSDSFCRLCYNKYKSGDKVICLPCQHNFHEYCIENWLKWVKSACPVDKKSVVRRQYMKDAIKERKNQLLEAHNLKLTCTDFGNDEECTDNEKIVCDSSVRRKIMSENHECESSQELELTRDPIVTSLLEERQNVAAITSPNVSIEKHQISKREKDATTHLEARTSNDLFPDKYSSQLRKSVSAIRKTVKTKESNRNKSDHPERFQEALEKVVSKCSNSRMKSPKETVRPPNAKHMLEFSLKSSIPSKTNEYFAREKITSRSNVTFCDILDADKGSNSGWVYLRNHPAPSLKAAAKKYNYLSRKTH